MFRLKVRKIGNSLGVILPTGAVQTLKVRDGDPLFLTQAPDGSMRITPYDPEFANAIKAAESFTGRYRNALRTLAK